MNKQQLILQLITTCRKYNYKDSIGDDEQKNYFANVVLYRALRMLTNKQIIKLINSVK